MDVIRFISVQVLPLLKVMDVQISYDESVFDKLIFGFVLYNNTTLFVHADMSSTAFIEPLPVIDFVSQLLNRDVWSRALSDADRVKVYSCPMQLDDNFESCFFNVT